MAQGTAGRTSSSSRAETRLGPSVATNHGLSLTLLRAVQLGGFQPLLGVHSIGHVHGTLDLGLLWLPSPLGQLRLLPAILGHSPVHDGVLDCEQTPPLTACPVARGWGRPPCDAEDFHRGAREATQLTARPGVHAAQASTHLRAGPRPPWPSRRQQPLPADHLQLPSPSPRAPPHSQTE